MSKSKKNVIDPSVIVERYGADAARLFILSDTPPERDMEWTEAGVEGAWRYVGRLWRLIDAAAVNLATLPATGAGDETLRPAIHRTIAGVTDDIDKFRFNSAVARIRTLSNLIEEHQATAGAAVLREALEALIRLMAPMMPHLAEETWARLGHDTLVAEAAWPVADPALLVSDTVTMAVQVNGRLRATITLARDLASEQAEAAALSDETVVKYLDGKTPKKVVVVPNRIVNVVV